MRRIKKSMKADKRSVLSYRRVGNHDVIFPDEAVEYVKKLGYHVILGIVMIGMGLVFVSAFENDNDQLPILKRTSTIITDLDPSDLVNKVNRTGDTLTGNLLFYGDRGILLNSSLSYFAESGGQPRLYSPITLEIASDTLIQFLGNFSFQAFGTFVNNVRFNKNITAPNICYSDGTNCTASASGGIYNATYHGTSNSVNNNNSAWLSIYNASYAVVGNCSAGNVVQNITNTGVQCVLGQTGTGGGGINYTELMNVITNSSRPWLIDNFYYCLTSGATGDTNWVNTAGGAQAPAVQCLSYINYDGIAMFDSGTTAVGNRNINKPVTSKYLRDGDFWEWGAYVANATILNSTSRPIDFQMIYALSDFTSTNQYGSNAVGFRYTQTSPSSPTNWTIYIRNNSLETTYNTGVRVNNGTYYKLSIYYQNNTDGVNFFINDTFITNMTGANIPLLKPMGWNAMYNGSLYVSTTRYQVAGVDYFKYIFLNKTFEGIAP